MLCVYYCEPDFDKNILNEAPQIKIDFNPNDETLEEFLKQHSNQHIYIDVSHIKDFFSQKDMLNRFKDLKEITNNWTLQLLISQVTASDDLQDLRLNALHDICHKYMFTNPVAHWEDLQAILSLKPSEVYLTNMLGFCLPSAKIVCEEEGAKLRLVANIAQTAYEDNPSIKAFFIRPEDVSIYEEYASIEFIGDKNVQEVMYRTYKQGYWYGNLSEIIIGLSEDLDSRRLPQHFGLLRSKCNKRCITGSSCSVCRCMREFMRRMEKTDTVVKPILQS